MKKNELQNALQWRYSKLKGIVEKFESRISGKRGAEDKREKFWNNLKKIFDQCESVKPKYRAGTITQQQSHKARYHAWKCASAKELAEKADRNFDEHGNYRGDYLNTRGIDFVGHWESKKAPYHDMGGEGLGLISITRTRYYARSSEWKPSSVTTYYLVGKNEAGTYFTHPVSPNCSTVEDACQWIWQGKAYNIIQRQGDIALIGGNRGPKMPKFLPRGHKINDNYIVHDTHPQLPLPQNSGERIIVGMRAAVRASEATRD